MIIDCFPFFNELDILEIRLNILNNIVDKFILVEASKTQTKKDKPFYYDENKDRFSEFKDKIIHIKVYDYPNDDGWAMENFQRNYIFKGLDNLNLNNNDIICISDVDEIWNPDILNLDNIYKYINEHNLISIDMLYNVFYLNLKTVNKKWTGTVISKFEILKNLGYQSPQILRNNKDYLNTIQNCGWHFGYQGGPDKVYEKWLACIEPIDKTKLPNKDNFIQNFYSQVKDNGYFLYSDSDKKDVLLQIIDDNLLPDFIIQNKHKYSHMML